ncbi:MAG: hypothetical protein PHV74_02760 [Dehalococcoidia bacterium]|nr:hypothetical protein [Dehalococcoidia bacterium]
MKTYRIPILALIGVLLLLLVMACGDDDSDATTPTSPTATSPTATISTPSAEPADELTLVVSTPQDEAVVDTSRITVSGTTRSDAVVSINGAIIEVDSQGRFSSIVNLDAGPNSIEVVASDFDGDEKSVNLTVIYAAALPLTVTEPLDEAVVTSSSVVVKGVTNANAVVTVNGEIVDIDASGSFSVSVNLEDGPNLIEVVASDFEGNSSTVMTTIIRIP